MYYLSLMDSLAAVPTSWPQTQPTSFHLEIANLMRAQFQPGPGFGEFPPESAAAVVDSTMRAERRFFDIDLRQIAKILFQMQGQSLAPRLRRTYDLWYQLLKNAWGWRLVQPTICPVELMVDPVTKVCILDPEKVYWPQIQPTDLHSQIAALVKDQFWPDVGYPPQSAVAAVDSSMDADQRFLDIDLRQIAKILSGLQTPRLTYGEWYQILKTAWGWRLTEIPLPEPDEVIPEPDEAIPEPEEAKLSMPFLLIGGLAVGLLLFSRR